MACTAAIREAIKLGDSCPEELLTLLRATPLLQVCKDLQPLLTEEPTVGPAMRVLAKAAVGRPDMTSAELSLIGAFFSEKASKPQFVDTAAACLRMVVEDAASSGADAAQVFTLVIDSFLPVLRMQGRPVGIRRIGYALLRSALTKAAVADPATCNEKRLRIILEALDGEGDPQLVATTFNLCGDLFEWAPSDVMKVVAEDYFEGLSSYFPVMFTQPAGCPVTKKDLQKGLADCLSHPALFEFCVPFLLGKIASPSTVVKLDVVHVIQKCARRYPAEAFLEAYGADIVTHLRNEVVKMSAFPETSGGLAGPASPTNVIAMCCAVLTELSKICVQTEDAKIMQVFEPVTEGTVQTAAAESARHLCSAYATMLFSTIIGSWRVCLASGGYVFSMLALVSHDNPEKGTRTACVNMLMLFSAVCTGFVDALDAGGANSNADDAHDDMNGKKAQLRKKLVKALPSFKGLLRATCDGLGSGCTNGDTTSPPDERDILAMCQGELLCAAVKLDLCVAPWLSDEEVHALVVTLVRAAVLGKSPAVRVRMGQLLCGYAALDPENRTQHAVRELAASGLNSEQLDALVELLETLSSATLTFATFALQDLLLPIGTPLADGSTGPLDGLSLSGRYAAVASILGNFTALDDTFAASLLERILARPPCPDMLESTRVVLVKATDEQRMQTYTRPCSDQWRDCLVKAAVVSCGPAFVPHLSTACGVEIHALLTTFAGVLAAAASPENEEAGSGEVEGGQEWRAVAMNGVASTVCCTGARPAVCEPISDDVAFTVASMWGRCLASHRDERAPSSGGRDSLAAEARRVKAVLLSAKTAESETLAALSFFPILASAASARAERGSLLVPYLAAAIEREVTELPLFWRGLYSLLANEDAPHIHTCEEDLLRLMAGLQSSSSVSSELVRAVFFLLDRKGAAAFLHSAVCSCPALLSIVCEGLSAPSMADRCAALEYLSSAAVVATERCKLAAHTLEPVERKLLQDTRDVVLSKTVPCLTDKKRLVRQAAGQCRNCWYRVK